MAMQLGIWAPLPHTVPPPDLVPDSTTYGAGGDDIDLYFEFATDIVRRADEFGFDVTLVAERWMGPDLEAWILATHLAGQTSRITLMPAVHTGLMTPQVVAKLAVSLDRISGGRAAVNLVNGWWREEFENYSDGKWLTDSGARYRRMDEYLEVMHRLWTEDEVTFEGEFYRLDGARLPMRPVADPPRVFGASSSAAGRDSLAKYGYLWFLGKAQPEIASLRDFDDNFDDEMAFLRGELASMQEHAAKHGRRIKTGINATVVVADTDEDALDIVDRLDTYATKGLLEWISVGGTALYGSPERVAGRIREVAGTGVDLLMLKFAPMRGGLERFGTHVIPLIKDLL